jgi:hypothetical protein
MYEITSDDIAFLQSPLTTSLFLMLIVVVATAMFISAFSPFKPQHRGFRILIVIGLVMGALGWLLVIVLNNEVMMAQARPFIGYDANIPLHIIERSLLALGWIVFLVGVVGLVIKSIEAPLGTITDLTTHVDQPPSS